MKSPQDCQNLTDIRIAIDSLDKEIIHQLARRLTYVRAAAKFKQNPTEVKASDRVEIMLKQRRIWAKEENLNPDVVEKLYRDLINYFINTELEHYQQID